MFHSSLVQKQISQFPKPFQQVSHPAFLKFGKKIRWSQILDFIQGLSTLVNAGISITHSLDIIANQEEKNSQVSRLIQKLKMEIEAGHLLGEALKKHPEHFSPLFIQLVLVGEQSGTLGMQLKQAATYLEKFLEVKNKFKKALTYPACVVLFTFVMMGTTLAFVVPQFQALFQSFESELPLLTRWVIALSAALKYIGIFLLVSLPLSIPTLVKLKKTSPSFAHRLDRLLLRLPGMGRILSQYWVARICHLLAVTYEAGLPFLTTLNLLSHSIKNQVYAKALRHVHIQIQKGIRFHQAMAHANLFPKRMIQMMDLGEQSGTLGEMLKKMSFYYEGRIEYQLAQIHQLLEPLVIGILGLGIGILIIAMYLPIFQIGSLF